MRKFLVKQFVGYSSTKIFGYYINRPRAASKIAIPFIVVLTLSIWLDLPSDHWLHTLFFVWFLIFALITFGYFRAFPVKPEELDEEQLELYRTLNK